MIEIETIKQALGELLDERNKDASEKQRSRDEYVDQQIKKELARRSRIHKIKEQIIGLSVVMAFGSFVASIGTLGYKLWLLFLDWFANQQAGIK